MDRIDLFRVFARVVETASYTRAADMLGMPRSTVSMSVMKLEAHVGARLLYRTTRKVTPTMDGQLLYERCLRLIDDVEETESLFRQTGRGPGGKLRVDVPGRIGRLVLIPALPAFLAQYPDISIDIGVTDRAVDLVEDSIDCVLRVGPLRDSGLIARPIGNLTLLNVASPAYLEKHGVPKTPDDLHAHFAVNYASPSTGRIEPWEWVEKKELRTRVLPGRVSVNNAEAYIASALAGLGLIQIPAYDVKRHIVDGTLVEVMKQHRAAAMPMTLLYHHRQRLSQRLQVFAEWLEALLKQEVL